MFNKTDLRILCLLTNETLINLKAQIFLNIRGRCKKKIIKFQIKSTSEKLINSIRMAKENSKKLSVIKNLVGRII